MRHLLVRPGAIGDFIVSLPALERLRGDYTEVWTAEPNVPLAGFADRAQSLAPLDTFGLPDRPAATQLLAALRSFDRITSWSGANRVEFREALTAVGPPVDFHTALPPDGAPCHAVDFYLSQIGAPPGAIPRIECRRTNGGFITIHPFSGSRRKNWPIERFERLATLLPAPVYWAAGPAENANRYGDLWSLAQWLAASRLYIGNDSGISHLAAAVGTPVLALFGPTDPRVWAPRGRAPVRVVKAETVDAIRIDEVLEAALALLA